MIRYTTEQAASIIALPIIIILLCWTVVIFHKNRKKWGPYDIPIVSVLVLSLLRNVTVLAYTLAIVFTSTDFDTDYCGIFTWIFNSIHTFQASSLTSIAVIGLFSAKLHRKNQSLRTFLTPTHIIYHLFCLTTLCACVGVAAILAQKDGGGGGPFVDPYDLSPCNFLPFELDLKFNVFIIVLHMFLASISTVAFVVICYNYYRMKKDGFDYIKKSNSDLSELSNNFHGINANVNDNRHYYDTYTINRSDSGNNYCNNGNKDAWISTHNFGNNSEVLSNNSTTVSSTNSRRPCLIKQQQEDVEEEAEVKRTGLETMHPVLIVCYLFYHLPLIVLCICPKLIQPWSVEGIALWLGLVQDLLIPIGLGIVDSRFCGWVTDLYRCTSKHTEEKLPQVGLDGKFRPFGLSSQPQSLDLNQDRTKSLQVEHRFPITNGSLYTSIDGRLPVIHNYRRHKEFRMAGGTTLRHQQEMQSSMVALHSSHLQRRDLEPAAAQNKYSSCRNCEEDQCPSHSDLHHLSPQYVHRKLSFLNNSQNHIFPDNGTDKGVLANHQNCLFVGNRRLQNTQNSLQRNQIRIENNRQRHPVTQKRLSQSQESINRLYFPGGSDTKLGDNILYHRSEMNVSTATYNLNANLNNHMIRNSRNLLRLNKLRLSRSEDSLAGVQVESSIVNQKPHYRQESTQYSSDDEGSYFKDYDSMSSSNSITTEANGDFEFFQAKEAPRSQSNKSNNSPPPPLAQKPKHVSNTKITRSSSKRSLENFQAFVEESETSTNHVSRVMILHRSNSYTTLEERKRKKRGRNKPEVAEGLPFEINGAVNGRNKKIKSVENLSNYPNSMVCIEDVRNNSNNNNRGGLQQHHVGSSVPDFKKVFISDYI